MKGYDCMARQVPEGIAGKSAIQTLWNAIRVRIAQIVLTSYRGTITGNGTQAQFTINHGVDSRDVFVQVLDKSDYSTVMVDVTRPNNNTITVTFGQAPASNKQFEVLVVKLGEGAQDIANGNSETF